MGIALCAGAPLNYFELYGMSFFYELNMADNILDRAFGRFKPFFNLRYLPVQLGELFCLA